MATVRLLAGTDLLTCKAHALVQDRHRSRECSGGINLPATRCETTRLPKSNIANGDDFQLPRKFIEVLFHPL
jgi:hypothetical protein